MIERNKRAPSISQPTTIGSESKAVINKLFGIMRIAYPSFLAGKEDADVVATKRLWHSHLSDYREEAISECADMMVSKFPARAPTIGQFIQMLDEMKGRKPIDRRPNDGWCHTCHSFEFTRHHEEVCVRGKRQIFDVTDEQIAATKKMFRRLR